MSAVDHSCPSGLVTVLLHRDDGRVLLLRRAAGTATGGRLAPPGGGLTSEESVLATALRTADDAVGVIVSPGDMEFCHLVHQHSPDHRGRFGFVFTARRWSGEPRIQQPTAYSTLVWAQPVPPPAACDAEAAALLAQFTSGALLSVPGWDDAPGGTG
ncbi:NUDIX domain-containing protein [Streptomyces sp. QH1-20]|uniref:NUDIX domain-containing protein n=1 Tax=Streptomyces sp. QH1-20 TaxID=3240934 RepID=UPI0035110E08